MKKTSVVEEAPAITGVQLGQHLPAAAAPGAVLNSVMTVEEAATHQPASYTFTPGRFTGITGSFWKLLQLLQWTKSVNKEVIATPKLLGIMCLTKS